jgi:putative FmdB family regulatory protein
VPIFEYLCRRCNRIFSFLSLSAHPSREPVCPRCGATGLERVPSVFAVTGPLKSAPESPSADGGEDDARASRLEAEAMEMMGGLDESDAEDPKIMARMMRRLAESSGEPITPAMTEMFRRMEAGEDPEALEEELGDQLEAEMVEGGGEAEGSPTRDDGLYSF